MMSSNLKDSITYFLEMIDTMHVENHLSEIYHNAIYDLMLIDKEKTLKLIESTDNEQIMQFIAFNLGYGSLLVKFPSRKFLKQCKKHIDRFSQSKQYPLFIDYYQNALKFLDMYEKDAIRQREFRATMKKERMKQQIK